MTIGTDNTITILCPTSEMGQGVLTALPLIVAEELDADWSKVKCEFAPGNPTRLRRRAQDVPGRAGDARQRLGAGLLHAAAHARARRPARCCSTASPREWKVPVAELTTDKSKVIHKKSKRSISYGDVAKFAKVPAELPKIAEADLKKRKDFKLIGRKDIGRVDVPSKVNGSAKYGIDVQVPGMVYASLLHSPMEGVKVGSVNADDVKKIKGVTHVLSLPFGVAVVGDTVEATPRRPPGAQGQVGHVGVRRGARSTPRRPRRSTPARPRTRTPGEGGVQDRRRRQGAGRRARRRWRRRTGPSTPTTPRWSR